MRLPNIVTTTRVQVRKEYLYLNPGASKQKLYERHHIRNIKPVISF